MAGVTVLVGHSLILGMVHLTDNASLSLHTLHEINQQIFHGAKVLV